MFRTTRLHLLLTGNRCKELKGMWSFLVLNNTIMNLKLFQQGNGIVICSDLFLRLS
jgi:hypothetical protein